MAGRKTNSIDRPNKCYREAFKASGKMNIIIAGLQTEVCVTWPTLNMLNQGDNIDIAEDACGVTSRMAHDAAMRRCVQAGAGP